MTPESRHPKQRNRVLALDYGRVHTGVAISDPSGLLARPLADVSGAAGPEGAGRIARMIEEEDVGCVVVGMPVSLSGKKGRQAGETEEFINLLKTSVDVPVLAWDERFTSKMAAEHAGGSRASAHGIAACILLEDYLISADYQHRFGNEKT